MTGNPLVINVENWPLLTTHGSRKNKKTFNVDFGKRNNCCICIRPRLNCNQSTGKYLRCYQVEGEARMHCPKRPNCFDKAGIRRRVLASSCYPAFFRGHQRVGTPDYLSMMRLRKIWAEGSFSVLKREHCISKIRKRGILAATEECLLAAMALNLKRMAKCHLSLSPNLLFCWGHDGFQQFFCFCQQVPYCTLSL